MGLHFHLPTAGSKEHRGIRSSLKPRLKLVELRKVDSLFLFPFEGRVFGLPGGLSKGIGGRSNEGKIMNDTAPRLCNTIQNQSNYRL